MEPKTHFAWFISQMKTKVATVHYLEGFEVEISSLADSGEISQQAAGAAFLRDHGVESVDVVALAGKLDALQGHSSSDVEISAGKLHCC